MTGATISGMSFRKIVWVAGLSACGAAAAQQDAGKSEVRTEKLADNVHMLIAAGAGNMVLLTGPDGAILVDDSLAALVPKVRAAIAALTDKPVRFVINTHSHFDHTQGNEEFGKAGSVIVAHDNTLKRLSTKQLIDFFNIEQAATPKAGLPVLTFPQSLSLHLNGEDIEAVHAPHAHTDNDVILYFRKANVVHMGDVVQGPYYGFIDAGIGGTVDGVIRAVAEMLARTDANTQFVPGHAAPMNRADLESLHTMMVTVRKRIAEGIAAGRTQEEVVASRPSKEFDARYATGYLKPDQWVQRLYVDLRKAAPPPKP
jgi:cyclase